MLQLEVVAKTLVLSPQFLLAWKILPSLAKDLRSSTDQVLTPCRTPVEDTGEQDRNVKVHVCKAVTMVSFDTLTICMLCRLTTCIPYTT